MRDSELVIDLNSLRENYRYLKSFYKSDVFFCPMVKANAYGMGANTIVKTLYKKENCKTFGVALIKEAMSIRENVIGDFELLVFSNFNKEDLDFYDKYNLTPVVSCFKELSLIADYGWKNSFHIKYNIGINRLSEFSLSDTKAIIDFLKTHSDLKLSAICSHISHSEYALSEQDEVYNLAISNFDEIIKLWNDYSKKLDFHLYNSASTIAESKKSKPQFTIGARVGLSLYGVAPDFINPEITQYAESKLKPVFQCKAKIIRIHNVKKSEGVSYGWSWRAQKDSRIGVIPIGYADGIRRCLSNNYQVFINGESCPLIGTICMDYCMVDLTGLSQKVGIGSEVLFFSPDKLKILSIKKMAEASHSIPYEIMTGWGHRLQRRYTGDT